MELKSLLLLRLFVVRTDQSAEVNHTFCRIKTGSEIDQSNSSSIGSVVCLATYMVPYCLDADVFVVWA